MVTLRTSSVDMEDHGGGRPRKIPRGPPDGGMGMPPLAINAGPRGRVGPPMGVGPPLPPPSAGPGGGPPSRTTATSRRGGRTRARSPIVAASGNPGGRRPGSTEPPPRPPSVTVERRGPPVKGENPSSAAAAAAAAAKAFSHNSGGAPGGGRNNQWPERHMDDRGGYPHSPFSRGGPPSKKWPPNSGDDPKMSGGPGHYNQHAYNPYGGYDGYPGESYGHGDRRYRGGSDRGGPPPHHQYKTPDGRGNGPESHRGNGGGVGPDAGRGPMYHHHHHDYHHRTYIGGGGRSDGRGPPSQNAPPLSPATAPTSNSNSNRGSASTPATASANASGGTSLVIGGTTPIHVPKPEVHPEPAERPTRASAASVFRGRGSSETAAASAPPVDEHTDEESPQKILLSLKTPTTSFEEKKNDDTKRPATTSLPLSPKDPPQLHNTTQQRAVDVFERSPEGDKNAPTIDIAPSFTLFNQSFDSLGENYLNVESTLNADSFGMMQTGSTGGDAEGITNVLRSAFSGGNGSTQLLAPSGSGHLTIGYSPVNSFGGASAPAPPRRDGSGGTMMLLGGPEARASSPTQVLSSYHQGYNGNRQGPLDDSHMRMSVGSFGAHSYGRGAPYGESNSSQYYYNGSGSGSGGQPEKQGDGSPPFYAFLKKYKNAFSGCSFLLPGLKIALVGKTSSDKALDGDVDKKPPPVYSPVGEPTTQDMAIAKRRVESSVCAFGGSLGSDQQSSDDTGSSSSSSPGRSIFRGREKTAEDPSTTATTVTPSSSTASPPRNASNSKQKAKYEEELPGRYYENESRLSWEFEENPPVEVSPGRSSMKTSRSGSDKKEVSKSADEASTSSKRLGATSPPASKMRYRCKLCGQPKQNHTCPYQQSLARSIGIMVYPAVNAFTAAEPGSIAPPLSEMNNFTDISEKGSVTNDSSPGRSGVPLTSPKQVTPESARASPRQLQLNSPPTTPGKNPTRNNNMIRRGGPSKGRKRPHGYENRMSDDQGDLLFVESMELKPQQFLAVSDMSDLTTSGAYSYLALPLPFAQRKRLSDNLFSLSNEVPKLTDECAQVLREAREKDKWDLAVAELMTQVIVVLHCRDGDQRFEGLRQYLLTLGIAC